MKEYKEKTSGLKNTRFQFVKAYEGLSTKIKKKNLTVLRCFLEKLQNTKK